MEERINSYIEEHKDDIIEDILQLIKFESINGKQKENNECLRHLLARANEMGFKTMTTTDYDVGIVEFGHGEETLGILVHLDVVEIGDPDKWTNDPFQGVVRDGYLWGRGTVDDKGAVVMSLYAMKAVESLGLYCNRKVWLIIGTSEEGEWTDIASFKNEFPVPDFGYSPDGEFPIFNIEKGYTDIVLHFYRDGKRGIHKIQCGDSTNTIPSKALIQLEGEEEIVAHGISSHSSTPENADNAITKLCRMLGDVTDLDFVHFINNYLDEDYYAKKLQIDDGSDCWQGEFVGMTTVVPTVVTLEIECVRLVINIRHKCGTTRDHIMRAFERLADEYKYHVEIIEYMEPMMVSRKLPFLQTMNELHEEFGLEGGFKVAAGTSYAKSMKNFVSWGPIFLSDPMCAHMEDERLSIDTMLLATKLYGQFISRILMIDES